MTNPEPHPTAQRCPACRDAPWLAWLCRTQRALADVAQRAAGAGQPQDMAPQAPVEVLPRAA